MIKIAFSGTHGTGKTTSAFEHAAELKMRYPDRTVGILSENVVNCPLPINREATVQSQLWIFADHLRQEIELSTKYNILVCDRSVYDAIAYMWRIDETTAIGMLRTVTDYARTYSTIYFKRASTNEYKNDDGLRDTDEEFRLYVDKQLETIYSHLKSFHPNLNIIEL